MTSKLTLWNKAGRFITGVVVLCFFLPFFGISCAGVDLVTMSGADMVGGCRPGGALTQQAEHKGQDPDLGGVTGHVGNVQREPLAIAALAIAIIAFGLAWIRTRGALIATTVLCVVGLGTLAGLYVKVSGDLDTAVAAQQAAMKKQGLDDDSGHGDMRAVADAGGRFGLWLTALGFASIAMLAGLAAKERAAGPPMLAAPPGYPPPPT